MKRFCSTVVCPCMWLLRVAVMIRLCCCAATPSGHAKLIRVRPASSAAFQREFWETENNTLGPKLGPRPVCSQIEPANALILKRINNTQNKTAPGGDSGHHCWVEYRDVPIGSDFQPFLERAHTSCVSPYPRVFPSLGPKLGPMNQSCESPISSEASGLAAQGRIASERLGRSG